MSTQQRSITVTHDVGLVYAQYVFALPNHALISIYRVNTDGPAHCRGTSD